MTSSADMRFSVPCPISAHATAVIFQKHGFLIRRCEACGFRFVYPQPPSTIGLYERGYFLGAERGFGYINYGEDKIAMRPFFERVLDVLERFSGAPGALVDVGAATGFFLKLAESRGWRVQGVELSAYASSAARIAGLDVQQGTLEAATFPSSSFDAVTLIDVIEHVPSPESTLRECRRILKPGGLVFINTPDTASWWARIFGRRWHAYCPPEHLSYFNASNLARLLGASGFRVVAVGKIGKRFTPAYVASMLHRWQGFSFWGWASRRLERSRWNRLALPIDIRDNFFIVGRKA